MPVPSLLFESSTLRHRRSFVAVRLSLSLSLYRTPEAIILLWTGMATTTVSVAVVVPATTTEMMMPTTTTNPSRHRTTSVVVVAAALPAVVLVSRHPIGRKGLYCQYWHR